MKKLIALLGGIMLTGASANVLAGGAPPPPDVICNESACIEGYEVSLTCLNLVDPVEGGLTLGEGGFDVDVSDNEGDVCQGGAALTLDKQELKCTNALKGPNGKGNGPQHHGTGEKEVEAEVKFTDCEEEEEPV